VSLSRQQLLRLVLVIVGVVSLCVYPLMQLWPTGWRWHPHNRAYEHMLIAVYATLGAFVLNAARHPERHRSLILFAGWSILVHGIIMGIDALRIAGARGHLIGDVPALILAGALILVLMQSSGRHNA